MKLTLDESLVLAAIPVIIALIVVTVRFSDGKTQDAFRVVCGEAGGAAVWDGRQLQCLKKEPKV